MFYFDEEQEQEFGGVEKSTVAPNPYCLAGGLVQTTTINSSPLTAPVFNPFRQSPCPPDPQDYYSNGLGAAPPRQQSPLLFGSTTTEAAGDWRSTAPTLPEGKQFYLGADDDEDDEDEELSEYDEEDCSDDSDDSHGVFPLDEDSGIGTISTGPSLDDEQTDQPSELVALPRSFRFGSVGSRGMRPPKYQKRHRQFSAYYQLTDDELGQGAYACVKTVIDKATQKEYAVKLVDKHEPGHTKSRIMREVEIFELCKGHPNIVQLVEWFEDADNYYLVFEKMRGGPLLNHIQRKQCFTEEEASQVTKDIATALKFLHDRGIAHRDVKPENILCTEQDRISPVKLCDLDLASKPPRSKRRMRFECNQGSENATSRSLPVVHSEPDLASPVGSAEFMAPEVVDTFIGDSFKYDKRCDLWALGVVVYVMLCGYPPFFGRCDNENCRWDMGEKCDDCQDSLFERIKTGEYDFPDDEGWAEISDDAKDLISRLLVKDAKERYTAEKVLKHPWVVHEAPQKPLKTADNLIYRNDSARDISMMNENFNAIKLLGPDPINESDSSSCSPPSPMVLRANPFDNVPASNVPSPAPPTVHTPTALLAKTSSQPPAPQPPVPQSSVPDGYYVPGANGAATAALPLPMINMNGQLIFAPTMAGPRAPYGPGGGSNAMFLPHGTQAHRNVPIFYEIRNGTTYFVPQQPWPPTVAPCSVADDAMPSGSGPGSTLNMGLETCQNAMNRQDSKNDIHNQQTRETQGVYIR